MSVVFFFFFFQAEDGIRDADVTGVQTCALPIFTRAAGELLPHRFTLTALADGGLFSVALVRGVSPPGRYPAPCPVEPGLSSRRVAATGDRPAFSGAPMSIPRGSAFAWDSAPPPF